MTGGLAFALCNEVLPPTPFAQQCSIAAAMGGRYLVHGSPRQRSVPLGESLAAARDRARECFARAARSAQACGVTYCIEPLSTRETDFINTVADAVALLDEIGSPALQTM